MIHSIFIRLRQNLHEILKNTGIKTQLENQARQLIQRNGGVNQVNVETLLIQLRGTISYLLKMYPYL